MPAGASEAISVKPDGVSSCACMTLFSSPGPAPPISPNVFMVSSPPNTSR